MTDPIRVCFALPQLFDAVIARFRLDCTDAENLFGWREPQKHKRRTARIVWVPGDPGGSAGDMRAARHPGGNPRSIATLGELFTVHISAVDPQFPEVERAQYHATRLLYDAWFRAVYLASHGVFQVQSLDWNVDKNERRYGTELVCVCEVEALIPDKAAALAPEGDTTISVTTSLEDVDEVTIAPP